MNRNLTDEKNLGHLLFISFAMTVLLYSEFSFRSLNKSRSKIPYNIRLNNMDQFTPWPGSIYPMLGASCAIRHFFDFH